MKPILEIQHVSKKYKLRGQETPYLTLRDTLLGKNKIKRQEEFWALNDINFNVYPGESIGVIGRNGAGKSTLLKILSRITPPTKGKIISRGRIASLLEVGTGFHAELTGMENIFLNGSILGLRKAEIKKKLDEIIDFSGVEKFIETPLKHYSSGMQLRLAFAVAAHLEPEILIIDEVLAVGDAEFQKKSLGKMEDVTKQGRTVIFVSHNMAAVQNLCNRGVLLQEGNIILEDNIKDVILKYSSNIYSENTVKLDLVKRSYDWGKLLRIISGKIINSRGEETKTLFFNEPFSVNLIFKCTNKEFVDIDVITSIESYLGATILGVSSKASGQKITCSNNGLIEVTSIFNAVKLTPGDYSIKLAIKEKGEIKDLVRQELYFVVQEIPLDGKSKYSGLYGYVDIENEWIINKK